MREPPGVRVAGRELPLDVLSGQRVGPWTLQARLDRSSTPPFPVVVEATRGAQRCRVFEGRTNPGTAWRWPWVELRYRPCVENGPERRGLPGEHQHALFERLGEALTPGSYVMLSCDGHSETARALAVGVPAAATPLGHLLWTAGARWYKVWYFPEGWREGHEKVQGNVPLDAEHRRRAERSIADELEAFLGSPLADTFPGAAEQAQVLIDATTASRKD